MAKVVELTLIGRKFKDDGLQKVEIEDFKVVKAILTYQSAQQIMLDGTEDLEMNLSFRFQKHNYSDEITHVIYEDIRYEITDYRMYETYMSINVKEV